MALNNWTLSSIDYFSFFLFLFSRELNFTESSPSALAFNMLFSVLSHLPLFIQIFKTNHINDAIFVHCNNDYQMFLLQKEFNNADIQLLTVKLNYFNINDYEFDTKIGIMLDASCKGWSDVIRRKSSFAFGKRVFWLINTDDFSLTTQLLSHYYIPVDSNVMIVHKEAINAFTLYETYKTGVGSNGAYVVNPVGFWNSSLYIKKRNRTNLHQTLLECVSVITEELMNETYHHFLKASRHDKPDTLHKLKFFTVVRYLQEMYNFSLNVKRTNSWGYSHNGSFDGLVGSLQRQEVEFGCSPVLFKTNRAEVVEYLVSTWQTKHSFLFRQPKTSQASYFSFYTRPLNDSVWRCVLVILLIAGLILNLMIKIKAFQHDQFDSSLSLIWLMICGAICQQGTPFNTRMISNRIILIVTFMFSMIIHQFYNANVLSGLLNEQCNNIRNLKDLLESNLKVGVEDMLFNKDYFRRTTDPIPLQLYKKKVATDDGYNFFDAERGMALVKRGGFAFHVDTSAAYRVMEKTFSEREICEVREVPLFPPQYVAAVARKGSHYKEYIVVGVSKMLESGLMSRIKLIWDSPKPSCAKMRYSNIKAVSIREISMALLFLTCGIFAAILVLLCEIYLHKIRTRTEHGNIRRTNMKREIKCCLTRGLRFKKNICRRRIMFTN